MKTAGIRAARQNLSELLAEIARGHEVLITDRGRPVARLVPPLPLSPNPFAGRSAFRRRMPRLRPPLSGSSAARRSWPRDLAGPLYLSSSVLSKLYFPEADSDAVDDALKGRRDLTVSDLALTELMGALARHSQRDSVDDEITGKVHNAIMEDVESGVFRRVSLASSTHRAAERLLLSARHSLTTVHALHLALAMTAGVEAVVTFEASFAEASKSLGLRVAP